MTDIKRRAPDLRYRTDLKENKHFGYHFRGLLGCEGSILRLPPAVRLRQVPWST